MADKGALNGIILWHYPFSPFARRVIWYLQLRGLEYAECIQPFTMPRPDLAELGIAYRRIPILSIGRDVYLDTRLIIQKLEERFPDGKLGASDPKEVFIQKLLEKWTVEGPVFAAATGLVPTEAVNDPKVTEDRKGFCGRDWTAEELDQGRADCLVSIKDCFQFLESTILADGRNWVLGTEQPSLADIEAIWPFDWLVGLEGSLPLSVVSEKHFPKAYAWIQRFRAALQDVTSSAPKGMSLESSKAIRAVIHSNFAEPEGEVDTDDPLALQKGTEVEMYPTDWGSEHRDRGRLVTLTPSEVTVASRSRAGDTELRIHAPRTGFRVTEIGRSASSESSAKV
ncbi:hypothetical protein K491DRAFT_231051 [Lophiostoma macrostomum CBS 122681]|uniref:GST N-terminal domain-containing protein n=1 Tax=Lophiostoma macrostomum CBS 122681 TaxID=1314788 RepID=A0A6A6SP86_9PLEO|nr:hypothetical protein K491DRAFT_231051 [Lophiostoma macrostomum CBS 122681]